MRQFADLFTPFLFGWLTLIPLFIGIQLLFGKIVADGQRAIEQSPKRALLIGFVNFLFLSIISMASFSLADGTGFQIFSLPGLVTLAILLTLTAFGLTSVVAMLSERVQPDMPIISRFIRGGSLFYLASWFPLIGWFGFLPYTIFLGFGGSIYGLVQRFSTREMPADGEGEDEKVSG